MPGAHMLVAELADELGRRPKWVLEHWRGLVAKGMPAPIHSDGVLAWSRAHVVAWLDRELPPEQKIAAAAYRAAAAAAAGVHHGGGEERAIANHRDRLERRYART